MKKSLQEKDIVSILLFLNKGKTIREASQEFNVTSSSIRSYVNKIKSFNLPVNLSFEYNKRNWKKIAEMYKAKSHA